MTGFALAGRWGFALIGRVLPGPEAPGRFYCAEAGLMVAFFGCDGIESPEMADSSICGSSISEVFI